MTSDINYLENAEVDGDNYFTTINGKRFYSFLIKTSKTEEQAKEKLQDLSFGPWMISLSDHKKVLDVMQKKNYKSCNVFLSCSDLDAPILISTVPYNYEIHNYLCKDQM